MKNLTSLPLTNPSQLDKKHPVIFSCVHLFMQHRPFFLIVMVNLQLYSDFVNLLGNSKKKTITKLRILDQMKYNTVLDKRIEALEGSKKVDKTENKRND